MFAQFWRQCSLSIVSCQSLFADGLASCRQSPGVRGSEGAHRELPSAKGASLHTGFLVPWLSSTVAPSLEAHCLSLIIQAAGQTLFHKGFCWFVLFFFFHVPRGLSGFMHPKKARDVCVNMA